MYLQNLLLLYSGHFFQSQTDSICHKPFEQSDILQLQGSCLNSDNTPLLHIVYNDDDGYTVKRVETPDDELHGDKISQLADKFQNHKTYIFIDNIYIVFSYVLHLFDSKKAYRELNLYARALNGDTYVYMYVRISQGFTEDQDKEIDKDSQDH